MDVVQPQKKKKIQDLEFTIISEENIPKELKDIIEEKKTGRIQAYLCK